jgi:hypothetical protein
VRPRWVTRRTPVLLAILAAVVVSRRFVTPGPVPAADGPGFLDGYRVADCPVGSADGLPLQCWLYGEHGAWRLLSIGYGPEVLIVEAEISSAGAIPEMADRIVAAAEDDVREVLVYTKQLRLPPDEREDAARDREGLITRVRWMAADGFSMLEFPDAAASWTGSGPAPE